MKPTTYRQSHAPGRSLVAILGSLMALLVATATPAGAADTVSQSTAQAVNIALGSSAIDIAVSNPPTAASSDGTADDGPNQVAPAVGLLPSNGFVSAGALSEVAAANEDGSSYACSGVSSPGGTIQVGEGADTCTPVGNGTGGVGLDLAKIPGVGSVLSSLASVTLTADALFAHAHANGTDPASGDATITGLKANIRLVGGLLNLTVPVTVPSGVNQNLLTAIVDALIAQGNPLLNGLIDALSNTLSGVISLTSNYQHTSEDGTLEVSALHVSLLNDAAAVADLAKVTVGPNADQAPVPMFSAAGISIGLIVLAAGIGVALVVRRRFGSVRTPAMSSPGGANITSGSAERS